MIDVDKIWFKIYYLIPSRKKYVKIFSVLGPRMPTFWFDTYKQISWTASLFFVFVFAFCVFGSYSSYACFCYSPQTCVRNTKCVFVNILYSYLHSSVFSSLLLLSIYLGFCLLFVCWLWFYVFKYKTDRFWMMRLQFEKLINATLMNRKHFASYEFKLHYQFV